MVAIPDERLQCMEVWGGNEPASRGVSMAGLDAAVYSAPYGSGAGGDVHYLSSCATGRITRVLLADVSGHGETVAATAQVLRDLMRRYINYVDPTRLVQSLNREFSSEDRGGRFATAIVATYWAPTGTLVLCNAGHPRPLVYRAATRRWGVLSPSLVSPTDADTRVLDIPLGIDADGGYTQFELRLARGDIVVMYTDALIEAQNRAGVLLAEHGLLEIARSLPPSLPPGEVVSRLLEGVAAHREGQPAADDTTVLALSPNDAVPRAGIAQGLAASLRIARASTRSLLSGRLALPLPQLRADLIGGAVVNRLNNRRASR